MKIDGTTSVMDIIRNHEKRIGTLELVLQGFLLAMCLKKMLVIIAEKINNLSKD